MLTLPLRILLRLEADKFLPNLPGYSLIKLPEMTEERSLPSLFSTLRIMFPLLTI